MRKILFTLCLFFGTKFCYADFNAMGQFYEWRSTQTCSAVTNFLVSTGPIFLANVIISSPVAGSQFTFINSSTTDVGVARSTSLPYMSDFKTTVPYPINTTLTNGFVFSTLGTSCVRFNWDYHSPPRGFEAIGKHKP